MKPEDRIAGLSVAELHRRHDEARRHAVTLRAQAIGAFWHGMHAAVRARLLRARRAAPRLSQRLPHHQPLRRTSCG